MEFFSDGNEVTFGGLSMILSESMISWSSDTIGSVISCSDLDNDYF